MAVKKTKNSKQMSFAFADGGTGKKQVKKMAKAKTAKKKVAKKSPARAPKKKASTRAARSVPRKRPPIRIASQQATHPARHTPVHGCKIQLAVGGSHSVEDRWTVEFVLVQFLAIIGRDRPENRAGFAQQSSLLLEDILFFALGCSFLLQNIFRTGDEQCLVC